VLSGIRYVCFVEKPFDYGALGIEAPKAAGYDRLLESLL
jgi:hypothetical protein